MLGKNLSFGLAFCADRAYLLQRKNDREINGEFLLTPFNFCTARRGCNVAPARSSLRKMPGNCDFMPLLDALRSKPVDCRNRAIKENQWVRWVSEIPTREKWRICWVFSRARVGGIINDFQDHSCENPIINRGLRRLAGPANWTERCRYRDIEREKAILRYQNRFQTRCNRSPISRLSGF